MHLVRIAAKISGYHAHNKLLADPWTLPQITAAQKHKLGAEKDGYILLQALKHQ
jgi:hypothetical protein